MFLKRRTRRKDGKVHTYYSVCESLRVHHGRTVQRQLLHLGELNTTQLDSWQHTLEVLHEDGSRHQRRLFTDRDGAAPPADDVVEVKLASFAVKQPRRFRGLLGRLPRVGATRTARFLGGAVRRGARQRPLGQGAGVARGQPPAGAAERTLRA